MLGIAISSLIYMIIGSKNLPIPLETPLLDLYDFANDVNKRNIKRDTKRIVAMFLVMEKSMGFSFKTFPSSEILMVPLLSVL